MSEWSVCPACGHHIHLGDDYCTGCGRKILYTSKQRARVKQMELEKALQKQVKQRLSRTQAHTLCVRCGTHNPPNATRCVDCGHARLITPSPLTE